MSRQHKVTASWLFAVSLAISASHHCTWAKCTDSGDKCKLDKDGTPIEPCCASDNTCIMLPGLGGRCITTSEPTLSPTVTASESPSLSPSTAPTNAPSATASESPSSSPSTAPTDAPSVSASTAPSLSPSTSPTSQPSTSPSAGPTSQPSDQPSEQPSQEPTAMPSFEPTTCAISGDKCDPGSNGDAPSIPCCSSDNTCILLPGLGGRCITTSEPTHSPSLSPTAMASESPSSKPSNAPTVSPTGAPSQAPSLYPTMLPSNMPSLEASGSPSSTPSSELNLWYLSAIETVTGQAPVDEWREYLTVDPLDGIVSISHNNTDSNLVYPDKDEWWARIQKKWTKLASCPYGDTMGFKDFGQEQCVGVGEGICTDQWLLGIVSQGDTTHLALHNANGDNEVYKWFPGATQLCIGSQYPDATYLRVDYEDGPYYLIGPPNRAEDDKKRSRATFGIVADAKKYNPSDAIIGFQSGAGTDLWQLSADGNSITNGDALWYPVHVKPAIPSSNLPSDTTSKPSALPPSDYSSTETGRTNEQGNSNDALWEPITIEDVAHNSSIPTILPSSSAPTTTPTSTPLTSSEPKKACFWRWDASCQDDHTYRSKDNLECEKYQNEDCPGLFGHFTQQEVSELIDRCPCSCRIECNTYKWESPIPTDVPSSEPTAITSNNPSSRPSASPESSPTTFPSSTPSRNPTVRPSRQGSPSAKPSLRASSSNPAANAEPAGYELALTTVKEDWIWTRDYSKCSRRLHTQTERQTVGYRWGIKNRIGERSSVGEIGEETGDDIRQDLNDDPISTTRDEGIEDEIKTSFRDFDTDDIDVDKKDKEITQDCIPKAIPMNRQSKSSMTAEQTCPSNISPFGGPNAVAQVDGQMVSESSGICASRINANVIWTLNDFTNGPILYAFDSIDGSVRQYPIAQGRNYDYEDIACGLGPIPNVGYIYVADIGDNLGKRGYSYFFGLKKWQPLRIYRIREPNLSTLQGSELTQWDELQLEYPDGPHNAEAMMIDPISRRIFILTKSSGAIWMTPKEWGAGNGKMTLEMVGSIMKMPDSLTGIDISPDGKEIVVKFYNSIHYFCMGSRQYDKPEDSWQDIVDVLTMKDGIGVPYIQEPQGEAVCFGKSFEEGIYTLSESRGMPLVPLFHYNRL